MENRSLNRPAKARSVGSSGRARTTRAAVLGALLGASAPAWSAEDPGEGGDAKQLVSAAYAQRRPASMQSEMTMQLVDGDRTWTREALLYLKQRNAAEDDQLFKFTAPPELRGSAVLSREHSEGEDDQWVYVPAYHTVRRIAGGSRGEAYLGTDFSYEDVLTPRWDEHRYRMIGKERVDPYDCVQVESTPMTERAKSDTAYSRIVYWIEPRLSVIVQQEHRDKQGKLLKRLRNSRLTRYGKYAFWDYSVMENVQSGHRTITTIRRRSVDAALSDDLFTQRSLKRN